MEIAGVGVGVVGLVGLVGTCLEAIDKVDAYKSFGSDALSLSLCFEADKHRFRQWLEAVGIVNGRVMDEHHPRLDDQTIKPLLYKIISRMCYIWDDGSATLSSVDNTNLDDAHAFPGGSSSSGKPSTAHKPPPHAARPGKVSKRARIGWALSGKAKFITQLETFEALVNRLYGLVPPGGTGMGQAAAVSVSHDIQMNVTAENASLEHRRIIDELRNFLKSEARSAINKWLGAASMTKQHFEKCLSTCLAGTCGWIIRTYAFLDWAAPDFPDDAAKLLWINGPAGYGKTILCASIIQHLKSNAAPSSSASAPSSSKTPPPLAYFFFSSELESRSDPSSIVRSWISQLVSSSEEALEEAMSYVPANEAGTATERELWELLAAIVHAIPHCTLVVDGLDECAVSHDVSAAGDDRFPVENRRTGFLSKLKRAVSGSASRVLVVSRDEVDIRSELRPASSSSSGGAADGSDSADASIDNDDDDDNDDDCQDEADQLFGDRSRPAAKRSVTLSERQISADDVRSDIDLFARSVVKQQLPKKDAALRDSLAAQMADKCDGMFLWIRLQEKRLRGGRHNSKRLQDMVQQMPPGLDRLYDRNVAEIMLLEGPQLCRARAILRWTAFALRPLTVHEVTEALAVVDTDDDDDDDDGGGGDDFCTDELPDAIDEEYVEDEIIDICRSLVEVRRQGLPDRPIGSATLHFVHFSVRQYLMSTTLPPGFLSRDGVAFADVAAQHVCLARICLRHLLSDRVWESGRSSAFLTYAAFAWYRHAIPREVTDEFYGALLRRFFDADNKHWDEWQEHRHSNMAAKFGSDGQEISLHGATLHVAAALGLLKTTEFLCGKQTADLNDARSYFGTPLQASSANGFLPLVQCLHSHGADINAVAGIFGCALNAAAAVGHDDVVRYLISKGADVTLADPTGCTALHLATQGRHSRIAARLLDVECRFSPDEIGQTPLHVAAELGEHILVKLFLDREADVNATDKEGNTPLLNASEGGHVDVVRLLLEWGASLEAANEGGRTALYLAAREGRTKVVKLLCEQGADFAAPNKYGWTPLNAAAAGGHADVVRVLVEEGADIAAPNRDGWTPLHSAIYDRCTQLVELLLARGADAKARSNDGWTPLNEAAASGQTDIVQLLLEHGADPSVANQNGMTPLFSAARYGHAGVVGLLLEHGADMTAANKGGWTPLSVAADCGHTQVVQLLVERGADIAAANGNGWTPLNLAANSGDVETVRLLLERGADAEVPSQDGMTPLSSAANNGHGDVVRILLRHGADLAAQDINGCTPLNVAAYLGHEEVVKLLLERGADPATPNVNGWTPLHSAADAGHPEVVKLILEHGGEANAVVPFHGTALHAAFHKRHFGCIKALMGCGASTRIPDDIGRTVSDWANIYGWSDLVGIPLSAVSDEEWDRETDLRRLRTAVVRLATDVRRLLRTGKPSTYNLRQALLYLNDRDAAQCLFREALALGGDTFCNLCRTAILESVHSCTSCYGRDFCDRCVGEDQNGSHIGWCRDHTLVRLERSSDGDDEQDINHQSFGEWLDPLITAYSDAEEGMTHM